MLSSCGYLLRRFSVCSLCCSRGPPRSHARERSWSRYLGIYPMQLQLYTQGALFSVSSSACYISPRHQITSSASMLGPGLTWHGGSFLQSWNGSSFFPLPTPTCHVYSDASGTYGSGAFADTVGWFQVKWPEGWEEVDISAKELVPVVIAAALWGHGWQGQHICFHSDNMAVVATINSKTARVPLLMHLLRCFSFYSSYFRFHYSCVHVPGVLNAAADALSRNNLTLFSSLVPQAPQFTIPPSLFKLLIATRPDWGSPAWTQLFVHSLTEVLPGPH